MDEGKFKGVNAKNWRDVHYETLSWPTKCKVKNKIYIYIYELVMHDIKQAAIAEYLFLIATLQYINEKVIQLGKIVDK